MGATGMPMRQVRVSVRRCLGRRRRRPSTQCCEGVTCLLCEVRSVRAGWVRVQGWLRAQVKEYRSQESSGLVVCQEACQLGLLILVNEELRETGADLTQRRHYGEVMCSCGLDVGHLLNVCNRKGCRAVRRCLTTSAFDKQKNEFAESRAWPLVGFQETTQNHQKFMKRQAFQFFNYDS